MALLKIQTGSRAGSALPLGDSSFLLGRDSHMQLRLSDQGASRQHAEIFRIGGLYFIRDLSSRNGTFVNDRKITEVILREGDQIRIAETVGIFLEGDDSPRARILRVEEGLEQLDSIRFRDTIMGVNPAQEPAPRKEVKRTGAASLPRQVARIVAGESSLQAIFDKTISEVGAALQADRADVLFVDVQGPEVRVRAVATHDTKGDGEIAMSRTILNEVIQRQEAVFSTNAPTDKRYMESVSIVASTIRSIICAPLIVGGATMGVLYVCNSQSSDAFQREDLESVAAVALQLSAVLGNLKQFEAREEVLRSSLICSLRISKPRSETEIERGTRVARYSRAIAAALGLPRDVGTSAWVAGLLHPMTQEAGSPDSTRSILSVLPGMEPILEAISCQDERHDGSGTPGGRLGDEIPILGRVLSLAKELDRLASSPEAGGASPGLDAALMTMRESAGKKFHPDVVQACLLAQRSCALEADGSWTGLS